MLKKLLWQNEKRHFFDRECYILYKRNFSTYIDSHL